MRWLAWCSSSQSRNRLFSGLEQRRRCRHLAHGELVDLLAVHLNRLKAAALIAGIAYQRGAVQVWGGCKTSPRRPSGAAEPLEVVPLGGFHHQGAGGITEQHAGAAIVPVDPAELVGPTTRIRCTAGA